MSHLLTLTKHIVKKQLGLFFLALRLFFEAEQTQIEAYNMSKITIA